MSVAQYVSGRDLAGVPRDVNETDKMKTWLKKIQNIRGQLEHANDLDMMVQRMVAYSEGCA